MRILELIHRIRTIFLNLFRPSRLEKELEIEVENHIRLAIDRYVSEGMSPIEARKRALKAFGNVEYLKEECRESWGTLFLSGLLRDSRLAFKSFVQRPAHVAIIVLILGLGIGSSTAVFSIVNHVLLKGVPGTDSGRLVSLSSSVKSGSFSMLDCEDLMDWNHSFQSMFVSQKFWHCNAIVDESHVITRSEHITGGYFDALGVQLLSGRLIGDDDDQEGAEPVAVISARIWRNHFNSDKEILGKLMSLNGNYYKIVGVVSDEFVGLNRKFATDVWIPKVYSLEPQFNSNRGREGNYLLGLLKEGVSIGEAQAEFDVLAARIAKEYPRSHINFSIKIDFESNALLKADPRFTSLNFLMLGLAILLLVMTLFNVSSLILARMIARDGEMAIRLSLGSGFFGVLRLFLIETFWFVFLGLFVGITLNYIIVDLYFSMKDIEDVSIARVALESGPLLFAVGCSFAIVVGLSIIASVRLGKLSVLGVLRQSTAGGGRLYAGRFLIVTEVLIATVLLIVAGLFYRSISFALDEDFGFQKEGIVFMTVDMRHAGAVDFDKKRLLNKGLVERISVLPGVESVSYGSSLPLSGAGNTNLWVNGQSPAGRPDKGYGNFSWVGPGYFETLGIDFVRGKDCKDSDIRNFEDRRTVIVNEALVKMYWPGEDPIGKYLKPWSKSQDLQVIGVVKDIKTNLWRKVAPHVYLPGSHPRTTICIRTKYSDAVSAKDLTAILTSMDPMLAPLRIRTIESHVDRTLSGLRINTGIVGFMGVCGFFLALAGTYGIIAYSVQNEKHDIGIRMAFGAVGKSIFWMILKRGVGLAFLGVFTGVLVAALLVPYISDLLYGVSGLDPLTYSVVVSLMILIIGFASVIPAYRASKLNPASILRG